MEDVDLSRLEFWNSRAALGAAAGTNDVTLKALEIQNISVFLKGCKNVLDAGCGNGFTAISILRNIPDIIVHGFDYSAAMIQEANKLGQEEGVQGRSLFEVGDLMSPPFQDNFYDVVYTERSLINLNGVDDQRKAVSALIGKVKRGGRLVLCESFKDGLDEINSFRVPIGLTAIEQPWHNHYLHMDELKALIPESVDIELISNFSSTYYFLSRVINAWLSKSEGVDPSYDAPINKLAFSLPSLDVCSQTKIIVLKKR